MGLIFLISNIYIVVSTLFFTGRIIAIPHLFRAFAPFYYLLGPFLLFYFRGAIFSKKVSLNRDWFHFLPAVVQFVDLIPFYFTSSIEKEVMLRRIQVDASQVNLVGSGLISAELHATIRLTLLVTYLAYVLICLIKSRRLLLKRNNGKALFHLLSLVIIVFILGALTNGIVLVGSFSGNFPINPFAESGLLFFSTLAAFLSLLFLQGYIFFIPENTFTLPKPSNLKKFDYLREKLSEEPISSKSSIETDSKSELLSKLELGMKVEHWYKINGLTVEECAKKMDCEKYILSKLINGHYKMRFNDLINYHRVEFVKSEIKKGSTKNITLEGLADEAGFNSRTTFYNAFIKLEGVSPLEFLRSTSK